MVSQITSLDDAERARDRTRFCYLCGKPRCAQKDMSREDVIPLSVMKPLPADPTAQWPLKLWVHRKCDETMKMQQDEVTTAFHRLHETEVESVRQIDINKAKRYYEEIELNDGRIAGLRLDVVLGGVWTWIRGLHAALYNEFLQPTAHHKILAPSVGFWTSRSEPIEAQIRAQEEWTSVILRAVTAASLTHWDGLSCYGDTIRYRCLWRRVPHTEPSRQWACFWGMDLPKARAWSRRVLGIERPWHGFYTSTQVPPNAAVLSESDVVLFNEQWRRAQYCSHALPPAASWRAGRRRR